MDRPFHQLLQGLPAKFKPAKVEFIIR